jgi:threonine/homoserine/homoserine lactone efflux protein
VINVALLSMFVPTFFLVSVTPGLCMTLAMTLGMSLGVRRTLWMMWGELLGVALVATAAVLGVAAFLLTFPVLFSMLQIAGAAYLAFVGWQMWQSRGSMAIVNQAQSSPRSRRGLWLQGFMTAVSNPKGWAFHMALLPPFIDQSLAFWPQLSVLLLVILILEFSCLLLYASGGNVLRMLLSQPKQLQLLNRVTGSLMLLLAGWLLWSALHP